MSIDQIHYIIQKRLLLIRTFLTFSIFSVVLSCSGNQEPVAANFPKNLSPDSLYIVVKDESGNPVKNAYIHYTCWNRLAATDNECQGLVFTNSSPVKPDTSSTLFCSPNPAVSFVTVGVTVNDNVNDTCEISLYNYSRSTKLLTLARIDTRESGHVNIDIDKIKDSIIHNHSPQKVGVSDLYWVCSRMIKSKTQYWRKLLLLNSSTIMYQTNSSGTLTIPYNSFPFSETINRVAQDGSLYGHLVLQGDILYIKSSASNYYDTYASINVFDRKVNLLQVVMKKL